ncbi:MAG TPA: NAD-dependent deacylase [Halalkalibaculum sp.]|nr:NAD-dependent deacylase [Halalkalibaculum sp.]
MKKVVVLTGAGMSADSGLKTFRDSNGLWEGHDIRKVATPEGWRNNPERVLEFYNARREQAHKAKPNEGHKALTKLEDKFDVTIITQNVDSLHERAGSSDVLHLHGQLSKVRSSEDASLIYEIGGDSIDIGDTADDGAQLRPHVVWFGEMVPNMEKAAQIVPEAEILIVIGTSLVVYPAASLTDYARPSIPKFIIDPNKPELYDDTDWEHLEERAAVGTPKLVERLIQNHNSN